MYEGEPVVLVQQVERFCLADVGQLGGALIDLLARKRVGFARVETAVRKLGCDSMDLVTKSRGDFEDDRSA